MPKAGFEFTVTCKDCGAIQKWRLTRDTGPGSKPAMCGEHASWSTGRSWEAVGLPREDRNPLRPRVYVGERE